MTEPAQDATGFLDTYNDLTVGQILSLARQKAGYSLPQVADILRIRARHLEAIEADDMAALPGRVYAIGFVRAYAEYLNLDGNKIVHILKSQLLGHTSRQQLNFPVAASESKLPPLWVIAASFGGFITALLVWHMFFNAPDVTSDIPDVPAAYLEQIGQKEDQDKNKGQDKVQDKGQDKDTADFTKEEKTVVQEEALLAETIVVKVTESSWISIKDDTGKRVLARLMKSGESFDVPEGAQFVMDTGNAGGVEIWLQGKKLGVLGERGGIVRDIVLLPNDLKERFKVADGMR